MFLGSCFSVSIYQCCTLSLLNAGHSLPFPTLFRQHHPHHASMYKRRSTSILDKQRTSLCRHHAPVQDRQVEVPRWAALRYPVLVEVNKKKVVSRSRETLEIKYETRKITNMLHVICTPHRELAPLMLWSGLIVYRHLSFAGATWVSASSIAIFVSTYPSRSFTAMGEFLVAYLMTLPTISQPPPSHPFHHIPSAPIRIRLWDVVILALEIFPRRVLAFTLHNSNTTRTV